MENPISSKCFLPESFDPVIDSICLRVVFAKYQGFEWDVMKFRTLEFGMKIEGAILAFLNGDRIVKLMRI